VMAGALLETQTMKATDSMTCHGTFPFGKRVFRDWKRGGHGSVDLTKAIAESCDVYFYKVGNQLGIDPISRYSRQFGLGSKTGIALSSERSGLVPSREWKQKNRGEPWYPGETISVAIGQGFLSVTPLQMAKVVSIVATNGQMVQPRLLKGIRLRRTGNFKEEPLPSTQQASISPQTFFQIKKGLAAVVTKGTAKQAQSNIVSIAGKTGTAQVVALKDDDDKTEVRKKHRDHAWFVAFAPVEEPKIAVAVIVEHMGHGGSAAAPLAKTMIEAYINFEKAQHVDSF